VQAIVDVPCRQLCPSALGAALPPAKGILLNSVTGEEGVWNWCCRWSKKYNVPVVAISSDDWYFRDPDVRFAVAKRSIERR
jgi:hypothetical protein